VKVAYIVPSARPPGLSGEVFDSIRNQTVAPAEVIRVANGPAAAGAIDGVRTLTLSYNTGFAAACNLGVLSVSSDLIALVNDDALLPADWAERLLPVMESNPQVVMATGVSVTPEGHSLCAGSTFNTRWQAVETRDPSEVDFLNFTAVMIRRDFFLDSGFFPSAYVAYYEDVDASLRALSNGHQLHVEGSVKVVHQPSSSAPLLGARRWFLLLRNRYWTLARHRGLSWLVVRLPLLLAADLSLWKRLILHPHLLLQAYGSIPFYPRRHRG